MYGGAWKLLTDLQKSLLGPSREKLDALENDWLELRYMAARPVIKSYLRRWEKPTDTIFDLKLVENDAWDA